MNCGYRSLDKNHSVLADRTLWKNFGSPQHRQVSRQAVRESLLLLKKDRQTLLLPQQAPWIHVAGKSADNIGNQCGGWTSGGKGKAATSHCVVCCPLQELSAVSGQRTGPYT